MLCPAYVELHPKRAHSSRPHKVMGVLRSWHLTATLPDCGWPRRSYLRTVQRLTNSCMRYAHPRSWLGRFDGRLFEALAGRLIFAEVGLLAAC